MSANSAPYSPPPTTSSSVADRIANVRQGLPAATLPVFGVLCVAALLRVIGLTAIPLWGDEYGSLNEATTQLGANLTSLLYSLVLRAFITVGGTGVVVLRLPAVIFGIAAVGALYLLARVLTDAKTALIGAFLLALSPYAIGYSQLVRFYSFFLLTGILALHALALLVRDGPSRARVAWLIAANVLCLAAHLLGGLVILGEVVSLLFLAVHSVRWRRWSIAALGIVTVLGTVALTSHAVRSWGFQFLARYTAAHVHYTAAHGIHLSNVVKIAFTLYVFLFGERVYPLWLWITLPGLLVFTLLLARGLWAQRHNRRFLGIVLPQLIIAPIVLYLILDAVTPQGLQGASPRYLTPLLGPLFVLLASGVTSWRGQRTRGVVLAVALALAAATLVLSWQDSWNYNGYMPDWPRVAAMVARDATPGSAVLVDGRSEDPARYYWSGTERDRHLRQITLTGPNVPVSALPARIIVVTDTDRTANQAQLNGALLAVQKRYTVIDGFVRYPLFAYALVRRSDVKQDLSSRAQQPQLPKVIYDLALQDLALPAQIKVGDRSAPLTTRGASEIGAPSMPRKQTLSLNLTARKYHNVLLATTLRSADSMHDGDPIARLRITTQSGSRTIILRKGREIDDWQHVGSGTLPAIARYQTGYTWTKLVSLVGSRSYPLAYHQFTAGIAVASIPVDVTAVRSVSIQYVAPEGILDIWALALR